MGMEPDHGRQGLHRTEAALSSDLNSGGLILAGVLSATPGQIVLA